MGTGTPAPIVGAAPGRRRIRKRAYRVTTARALTDSLPCVSRTT
jgi:hypothetical protein